MYQMLIRLMTDGKRFGLKNMIILLPGRGQSASDILDQYNFKELNETVLIAIEPAIEWYPIPRGMDNQNEAIEGLKFAIPNLEKVISKCEKEFNIPRNKVALAGFSAGAVMAIQIAANSEQSFAAVISHAGAILDPTSLPAAKNDTPFLLLHAKDDDCFSWDERYLPMKKALIEKGYEIDTFEKENGGHYMSSDEAYFFLANKLDINDIE